MRSLQELVVKAIVSFCIVALALVATTGCTHSKKNALTDAGNTLRVAISTGEPSTLDWNLHFEAAYHIVDNIMDGLITYDPEDLSAKVIPALASSWESSKDGRVWTFHLREAQWTDGVPLNSQQFVDAYERALNPKTAGNTASDLYFLKNARSFFQGKVTDFNQVGVHAKDSRTLEVVLEDPMPFFPSLTRNYVYNPIRKDLISRFGDKFTEIENLQTIGAFRLKEYKRGEFIVLERNPKYFASSKGVERVLFRYVDSLPTALNLFEKKMVDVIPLVPASLVKGTVHEQFAINMPDARVSFVGFNVTKAPFNDARVRRAIGYAIDRSEVVKALGGRDEANNNWIPKGSIGYSEKLGVKFDLAKSKRLLGEAGYKSGADLGKLELPFQSGETHQKVAENVQAQLKRNLGLNLELRSQERKLYLTKLRADPPAIFAMHLGVAYPDSSSYMDYMLADSDVNFTKWKSPVYDKIAGLARSEMSNAKRERLYGDAQDLLLNKECVVVPLYNPVDFALISSRVSHYPILSYGGWFFKQVVLAGPERLATATK